MRSDARIGAYSRSLTKTSTMLPTELRLEMVCRPVGWGMATGIWEAMQMKASAKAVLTANGSVEIASAPLPPTRGL
jgi:hypothetical protein